MSRFFFLFQFFLFTIPAVSFSETSSSRPFVVSGKVVDATTGVAVEYANIVLFSEPRKEMVSGVITDPKGEFRIETPAEGRYYVRVSFIGYEDFISESFVLGSDVRQRKLALTKLQSIATNLQAVEVVGEKRLMEYSIDKRVVNVEKNIVNDGGTAVDVLSNVPSVSVDAEGNVSMKGSTNVSILIDGKPAELSGLGLDQIAAATIESVEILSNPSAKYNPEGMSGIINIKTKKRQTAGINGLINASGSTAGRYNASLNLNYGRKKVNYFANLNYNQFLGRSEGLTLTETRLSGNSFFDKRQENQRFENRNRGQGGNAKLGFDYKINAYNDLTFSMQFDVWDGKRIGHTPFSETQLLSTQNADSAQWVRSMKSESNNYFFSPAFTGLLAYKKTFSRPRQELTFDGSFTRGANDGANDVNRWLDLPDTAYGEFLHASMGGQVWTVDGQLNYVHPLGDKGKVEVGYHGRFRSSNRVSDQYLNEIYQVDMSNAFDYFQNIQGIYALWANSWGPWSMQLGGRMELADAKGVTQVPEGSFNRDTTFSYRYYRFYPTVHFSYLIQTGQELQLSYSRRVNRPGDWSLNPFVDYSNYPFSISHGNPELVPEDVHSVELNYSKYWKKTSVYANVYWRYIGDVIRQYSYLNADDIRTSTSLNLASGQNYGLDIVVEQEINAWWRINVNANVYRNENRAKNQDVSLNTEGYSYSFKLNSSMTLPYAFFLQISGQYSGPQYWGQTLMHARYGADLALRKSFMKNKWSVGLRVSDLFNTGRRNSTTTGLDFISESQRKRLNSRALFLSISYRINQGVKQQRQSSKGVNNEGSPVGGESDDI